jgi:RNA polymerase sigma-70 factor (ECF subfamily)
MRELKAVGTTTPRVPVSATRVASEGRDRVTSTQRATDRMEAADEAGLREAFLSHGGELFGFARRSLNSTPNAEDVVQETFSRAWRSRARFDPTLGSLRTWLFTIERRVILDYSAKAAKNSTVSLDQAREPASEDHVERAMLGWQMESALQRLDDEHRMIITEIYFNGRSGREVAEMFGLPEGTVRSRSFYALRMLRLLLEEGGWDQ